MLGIMLQSPDWATRFGLTRKGNYYEGFVDDASSVLEIHKRQTVTTWGTRRSTCIGSGSSSGSACNENKENTSPESVRIFLFVLNTIQLLFRKNNHGCIGVLTMAIMCHSMTFRFVWLVRKR